MGFAIGVECEIWRREMGGSGLARGEPWRWELSDTDNEVLQVDESALFLRFTNKLKKSLASGKGEDLGCASPTDNTPIPTPTIIGPDNLPPLAHTHTHNLPEHDRTGQDLVLPRQHQQRDVALARGAPTVLIYFI